MAKPNLWELYDIDQDESESRNLASVHPELVAAMAKQLRSAMDDDTHFPVRLPVIAASTETKSNGRAPIRHRAIHEAERSNAEK